jgi:DNA-binding MarR family transcriptional regulator
MKHFQVSGHRSDAPQHRVLKSAEGVTTHLPAALKLVEQLHVPPVNEPHGVRTPVTEQQVLTILRVRRSRSKFFDAELFADPAWDIMLELYAAHLGQRRVSVSDVCLGAAVPATTAMRWIKNFEQKVLISRRDDPMDGRRVYLCMAQPAAKLMSAFFEDCGSGAAAQSI